MIVLNLTKMAIYVSQEEESVRSELLNDLIVKAFDSPSEVEKSLRMSFNARLFTELRERKLWPIRAV